jgi:hypothetical protein
VRWLALPHPPPPLLGSSSESLSKYFALREMPCKEADDFHLDAKDVMVDCVWDGNLAFAVQVLAMGFFPCAVGQVISLILLSSFFSVSESWP